MRKVFLDYASTAYTCAEVMQSMMPYFTTEFGNAASGHSLGRSAEKAIAKARAQVAAAINADPSEIYFTSGATEANNWIINGTVRNHPSKRVLLSGIEHPSIYEHGKALQKEGFTVEYIAVDKDGIINVADLLSRLNKPAALVSVMVANNEVGTIQYMNTISQICRKYGVPFHTDATQAIGSVYINVKEMDIDALSLSGHKIYGPKGVGALYIRNGLRVDKMIHGGHQERNRRAGTHNVPAIVGIGSAVEIAVRDASTNNSRIKMLRDLLIMQIMEKIPNATLNGHRTQRLANNANFSFKGIEGESLMMMLDMAGIAVSTGSACSSGALQRSYVLEAMGVPMELNQGSIRFSLGRNTTREDIDYTVAELSKAVKKLRSMSPFK